ncbi:hypothetical protein UPYG_G00121070 [Umbra pygmaea]|uniref:Uncharacterized protein n=1 Tax=Umbra pygmaea TaxID=75934 RepID=A0ABD0XSI1_UMBPY
MWKGPRCSSCVGWPVLRLEEQRQQFLISWSCQTEQYGLSRETGKETKQGFVRKPCLIYLDLTETGPSVEFFPLRRNDSWDRDRNIH